MTDLLKLIWPLMDAVDPVFNRFLTVKWPDGSLEQLIALGMVNQIEDAEFVRCPDCWDHEEELIELEGPPGKIRFWIPCPESLRVEIPPNQRWQWTIKIGSLARQLAASLQLVGEPMQLNSDCLWRLGRGTFAGYVHDVLFARRVENDGAELLSACDACVRPLVLFGREVPRHPWWQDRKIPAETVRQIATCSEQGLAVDRAQLESLASQFAGRPVGNMFRRRGEYWELTFAGSTAYLKDSVGLSYIARLLSEPERNVPAVSLLALRSGIDPAAAGSSGEILDDAARIAYSNRYQELCEELESATRNHDLGTFEKLQEEKDQLLSELARATGIGGRSRQKTDIEKIRKAVSMAVARDFERIVHEHAALGQHLLSSITSGLVFCYSPEGNLQWLTT